MCAIVKILMGFPLFGAIFVKMTPNDQNSSGFIRVFDEPFWLAPNSYITNGFHVFGNAEFASPNSEHPNGF